MSDTRLGISITAKDTNATASVKQLQATIKGLQETLAVVGGSAADAGGKISTALTAEIAKINAAIAARTNETAAIRVTAAAVQDKGRIEAEYINRNIDLIAQKQRAEAAYINQTMGLVADKGRAEASYINRDIDLIANKHRAEATYINQTMGAEVDKARAEAEYANRNIELIHAQARAEAEYTNAAIEGAAARSRAEAEYMNRDLDLKYAQMRREAALMNANINAQSSQQSGAGTSNMLRHGVALFDEGMRGQRGSMFSTIGAAARDAGLGVGLLSTSVVGLVAVMGAEALIRGGERMGEWASKTRAAASAAAMSVQDYSRLAGALELVGVKSDSADSALRRIAINTATAMADPSSKMAEAFHNLGISQEELSKTGGNTGAVLKLLANAFNETNDSENKSAAFSEIAGRGFESIIPALQQGAVGLEALENKAQALGLTLDEKTAKSLASTGENLKELGEAVRGHGIKAMEEWMPTITALAGLLGTLASAILYVVGAIGKIPSGFFSTEGVSGSPLAMSMLAEHARVQAKLNPTANLQSFGPPAAGMDVLPGAGMGTGVAFQDKRDVGALTPPVSVLDTMRNQMTAAALKASAGGDTKAEGRAEIEVMKQTLQTAQMTAKEREQITTEMQQKQISLNNQVASAGRKEAKQSYEDFAAGERLKVSEAQGNAEKIIAIYSDWMNKAKTIYGQQANEILTIERQKTQALNAEHIKQIKDELTLREEMNKYNAVAGQAQSIAGGTMVYAGQRTLGGTAPTGEGTDVLAGRAQANAGAAAQAVAAWTEVMNSAQQGSDQQKEAAHAIIAIETQSLQERIALYNKAAEAAIQAANKFSSAFTKLFENLGNQFETFTDSMLKALIAPQVDLIKQGLTTIKFSEASNEMRQAVSKILMSGIDDAAKSVEGFVSQTLAQMLSKALQIPITQGGGLSDLLGQGLSKLIGVGGGAAAALPNAAQFALAGTSLTAAGTALNTAAAALGTAAASLSTAAAANSAGGAASGAGGAGAGLLGLLGFARGGIVPSAAGGMVAGMGATLALLHPREMVLPSNLSDGMQRIINNNSSANLNAPLTINNGSRGRGGTGMSRSEFSRAMSLHGGALLGEARNMMRSGWRPS